MFWKEYIFLHFTSIWNFMHWKVLDLTEMSLKLKDKVPDLSVFCFFYLCAYIVGIK